MNLHGSHLEPLSQHRAHLDPWVAVRFQAVRLMVPVLLVLALLCVGAFYAWMAQEQNKINADVAGAPLLHGTAILVNKAIFKAQSRIGATVPPTFQYSFSIDHHGALVTSIDSSRWLQVRVGDAVPVTYRIGKSGDYYIQGWKPVK